MLRQHKVFDKYTLPTDTLVEMICVGAAERLHTTNLCLSEISILSPIFGIDGKSTSTKLDFHQNGDNLAFTLASRYNHNDAYTDNVQGMVAIERRPVYAGHAHKALIGNVDAKSIDPKTILGTCAQLGDFFTSMEWALAAGDTLVARLTLSSEAKRYPQQFLLHPGILDGVFVAAIALARHTGAIGDNQLIVPIHIGKLSVFQRITRDAYSTIVKIIEAGADIVRFEATLLDENDNVVLTLEDLIEKIVVQKDIDGRFDALVMGATQAQAGRVKLQPTSAQSQGEAGRPDAAAPAKAGGKIRLKSLQKDMPVEAASITRRAASPPVSAQHANLENAVADLLADVLSLARARIDKDQGFVEQGLDSILGLEFVQKINKKFLCSLKTTTVYEYPTITRLCELIRSHMANGTAGDTAAAHVKDSAKPAAAGPVSSAGDTDDRPVMQMDYIRHELKKLLADTLSLNEAMIDDERGFMELGLDSILGVEFIKKVNKRLQLCLKSTCIYEHASIGRLAGFLARPSGAQQPHPEVARLHVTPDVDLPPSRNDRQAAPVRLQEADINSRDIAVIGMAAKFAGSNNVGELWEHIKNADYLIKDVPHDHWDFSPYFSPDKNAKNAIYCKSGSFIDGVDEFDPAFFHISGREAEALDPQLRLFLQVAWETLEDAGCARRIRGSETGLYLANCFSDYYDVARQQDDIDYQYLGIGNARSSLANRVSYFLDIGGPSMTIDTACSSSLVALDLACQALRAGRCSQALVGGVNLSLHPSKYLMFCAMHAFSTSGHIAPFDEAADGYVPGEGIAAILLKPLSQAIADRDIIHGVIKGTYVNSGGKSSGPTVPNLQKETDVLVQAWKDANIDPQEISYFEAHGTGTKIGDPLEFNAAKEAFAKFTDKRQFCAMGTIKGNLGHTEATAGLAGVIKVLLQMRHNTIPTLPRLANINSLIDTDESAFYFNKQNLPWRRNGAQLRKAVVSSFGMGGTYAHAVLEEFDQAGSGLTHSADAPGQKNVVVLSAMNEDRLREYAARLVAHIGQCLLRDGHSGLDGPGSELTLAGLAHTLQSGRADMEERLACVASSLEELQEKLQQYVDGHDVINGLYRGNASADKGRAELLLEGEEGGEFLRTICAQRQYAKLAQFWTSGIDIDWRLLHAGHSVRRLSLPTYPFAKERYWIPTPTPRAAATPGLHPMLDSNVSTLDEQTYQKRLSGEEYYLRDHQVNGQRILPGAGYLEMARAAATLARQDRPITRLTNIVWTRPVVLNGEAKAVYVSLYPQGDAIEYTLTSGSAPERIVHGQGRLEYAPPPAALAPLPLNAIQARCTTRHSGAACYDRFQQWGLQYGSSFKTLQALHLNGTEALAHLALPPALSADLPHYGLHPSLLDGALQSCIGLIGHLDNHAAPYLPFALEEILLHAPLTEQCYAHVTAAGETRADAGLLKFNIVITDTTGQPLVTLREFAIRQAAVAPADASVVQAFIPTWQAAPADAPPGGPWPGHLLLWGGDQTLRDGLRPWVTGQVMHVTPGSAFHASEQGDYTLDTQDPAAVDTLVTTLAQRQALPTYILHVPPTPAPSHPLDIAGHLDATLYPLFHLTQSLIKAKVPGPLRLITLHGPETTYAHAFRSALSGFAKTVTLEQPRYLYKVLGLDTPPDTDTLITRLRHEWTPAHDRDQDVRYVDGLRQVRRHTPIDHAPPAHAATPALKSRGVYLITGGSGGLGRIFAEHLARTYQARLILTGRSAPNDAIQAQLQRLRQHGADAHYLQADVAQAQDNQRLRDHILATYGELNGILHAAGLTRDAYLLKKDRTQIQAVLAPKVHGSLHLDAVFHDQPLDFFVLFSSIAAVWGNAGQMDYAYANAFQDSVAGVREQLRAQGQRHGKTVSIQWPLWAEGGMHVDAQTQALLTTTLGMRPLSTAEGLAAFTRSLISPYPQYGVMAGDGLRMGRVLGEGDVAPPVQEPAGNAIVSDESDKAPLYAGVMTYLKEVLAKETKISPQRIRDNEPLERYGIDSILITQMTQKLEARFGRLSKTLFFEYKRWRNWRITLSKTTARH